MGDEIKERVIFELPPVCRACFEAEGCRTRFAELLKEIPVVIVGREEQRAPQPYPPQDQYFANSAVGLLAKLATCIASR